MKIDVDAVLRARLPRHYRYIPRVAVRWLERFIRQDSLNALLDSNAGLRDAEFCAGVLRDLDVDYRVMGEELLPPVSDRRVTLVCNHPLGALDGIALIDYVSRRYGGRVRFVVNDLLTAVEPLRGVFVPINKHGRQNRGDAAGVDGAFAADDPVLVFPAGMCSRRSAAGVCDLEWHKMFVNKSIEYRRKVIPLFFDGENSKFFYNFAKLRTILGIKFNLEMICLPREIFLCRGRRFDVVAGAPVDWRDLRGGREASEQAAALRSMVYSLNKQGVGLSRGPVTVDSKL